MLKLLVFVVALGWAVAQAAPGQKTCCEKAFEQKKECANKCCIKAHKEGKSCSRCNPNQEDLKILKAREAEKKAEPKPK